MCTEMNLENCIYEAQLTVEQILGHKDFPSVPNEIQEMLKSIEVDLGSGKNSDIYHVLYDLECGCHITEFDTLNEVNDFDMDSIGSGLYVFFPCLLGFEITEVKIPINPGDKLSITMTEREDNKDSKIFPSNY